VIGYILLGSTAACFLLGVIALSLHRIANGMNPGDPEESFKARPGFRP
jgi:hypothetical protein